MLLSCVSVGCFTSNAAAKNDASVSASSTSSSVGANDYGLADNIQNGTILHCFDWKYNDIKAELPNIAEAGFTSIQTSPAQPQVTSGKWYWLYQPLGFYIGTNDLGTKAELQSLCTEAEKYGGRREASQCILRSEFQSGGIFLSEILRDVPLHEDRI